MALCGALGPDLSPVTPRPFTWQAWHKLTSTFVLRGRRGTYGIGWRAWSGFVARDAAAVCVADVVLGDIHLHFTWQVWHKLTSTVVLRGRRGTYGIPSFCVAGVALMALGGALGPDLSPVTPRLFAWQAWYLVTSTFISRGRRGTNSHPPSFCVAGVALMAYLRFAWQAWHLWHWVARLVGICRPWRRGCLRGRRGTWWHPPSFHVAGVAQTHIHRRFAWQAWYLVTSTFISRGRHGTNSHPPSFCVAGVALMAYLRFAWQAWHLWHWVARLVRICRPWRRGCLRGRRGLVTSTFISRGRRGTNSHPPSFCVAGVALMAYLRFAWQAWHLWHWVARLVRILSPVTPRLFAWQAWYLVTSTFISRGRCGTNSHPPSFCVAGVALMAYLRFAWQAWHGTYGIGWRAWSGFVARDAAAVCAAGVVLGDIHLHFSWQAWHKLTSTVVLRGRRVTHTYNYIHTYVRTCIHTHIHTYTHTYIHTVLPSRSFTTSFVFPSFPVPAKTIEAHYWKKLTCGVIQSFNLFFLVFDVTTRPR